MVANDFEVEIGSLEYGIEMDGILGLDFLLQAQAVLDLRKMQVHNSVNRGRRDNADE
jgi:hypothetical protein